MSKYVVVGSSRGLGSALVEELLRLDRAQVIGISRTGTDKIANYPKWKATGRYEHIEMDVVAADCHLTLNAISSRLPQKPVCIIFNSALVKADINNLRHIDYDVFDSINRVQIDGFGQILRAFEKHLLTHGGMLVGISSFSALFPPVMEPRIAYPASKAYLDMSLRCLRFAWNEKVKVVTVHLGHMREEGREHFLQWLAPCYSKVARKIVETISGSCVPDEINYPLIYSIVYRYLLILIPEVVYCYLFRRLARLLG